MTAVSMAGCDNNNDVVQNPVVEYENPMKMIGVLHNQGLDFALNEIKSSQGTRTASEADILAVVDKFIVETFQDLPEEQMAIVRQGLPLAANATKLTRSSAELAESENQKIVLTQLDEIMTDTDYNLGSLRGRIVALEEEAMASLDEEELNAFLAGSAVAYYTMEYWQENYEEWEIGGTDGYSWKKTGKADVTGAIGAAGGGVAGVLLACGPVGWKGWAALVIGGAVATSLEDAIDQLW